MSDERDEFHGVGGSYEIRDGKRTQVQKPTADHPEGNCARRADGTPVDAQPPKPEAAPAAGDEVSAARRNRSRVTE